MGEVGWAGVSIRSCWMSGCLIAQFCIWSPLRDLCGSFFLEHLAFPNEFSQGVNACAKEYGKLVVWCSFIDYVAIILMCLAFEHYVPAHL